MARHHRNGKAIMVSYKAANSGPTAAGKVLLEVFMDLISRVCFHVPLRQSKHNHQVAPQKWISTNIRDAAHHLSETTSCCRNSC